MVHPQCLSGNDTRRFPRLFDVMYGHRADAMRRAVEAQAPEQPDRPGDGKGGKA